MLDRRPFYRGRIKKELSPDGHYIKVPAGTKFDLYIYFCFVVADLRLKFMTALMLIVLSISIAITILRFGSGVLQDNFVAEMSTNYENSAEFVSFYGLLNFYMYTMAFVYSPSKNAMYGR